MVIKRSRMAKGSYWWQSPFQISLWLSFQPSNSLLKTLGLPSWAPFCLWGSLPLLGPQINQMSKWAGRSTMKEGACLNQINIFSWRWRPIELKECSSPGESDALERAMPWKERWQRSTFSLRHGSLQFFSFISLFNGIATHRFLWPVISSFPLPV